MTIVARKGKLSLKSDGVISTELVWERIEDMLTADVFGAYRYLPLAYGLIPFLRHARDEYGQSLESFLHNHDVNLERMRYARTILWPSFHDGSEPDGVVLAGPSLDDIQLALLIEAKLFSPQHRITGQGGVTRSQIGHYAIEHIRGHYTSGVDAHDLPELRAVLYINRHSECPADELRAARREIMDAHLEWHADDIGLFWVSWLSAGKEAVRQWHQHSHEVAEKPWLRLVLDLREDLAGRGLLPRQSFRGLPTLVTLPKPRVYANRRYVRKTPRSLPSHLLAKRRYSAKMPFSRLPKLIYARA